MVLSSDELEILEYLKSWKGTYVSMVEICRFAGGRKRFKETPQWAKSLMARLVEANLVQMNERGHYRIVVVEEVEKPAVTAKTPVVPEAKTETTRAANSRAINSTRFVSPQMEAILKKSGKNFPSK